jgi:hypothetical protein
LRWSFPAYELVFEADFALPAPRVPELDGRALARVPIRRARDAREPATWIRVYAAPERPPWLSVGRVGADYLLRFHGHADFVIDATGAAVSYAPAHGCSELTVEQLVLDQVIPQLLHLRGRPTLHGSAVATVRGVAAFVGPSGAGKSTLAASYSEEAALVCDDCIAPVMGHDRVTIEPSYASVRLWDDAAAALGADADALARASDRAPKRRMPMRAASGELLLRRVFVLENADAAPSIERLRGADALMAVAPHMHRLDPDDRARQAAELDFLARLAAQVPIARLRFRRGYDELAAVRAVVARDLAQAG